MVDGRKYHRQCQKLFYRGTSDFRSIMQKIWSFGDPDESGKSHALCPVESRSGREAYLEDCHPHGYPGSHWCELFLESVCKRNGEAGLYLEAEPEVSGIKDTGYGEVCPSAFLGKRLWGGRDPGEDPASKDPTGVWKNTGAVSKEETYRTSKAVFFLSVSDGSASAEAETDFYAVRSDIRKLDLRIRQMEFLQKEGINTREELAAYRKPLEEQVLSLMKERRTLYRKEPGGMRIQEINGELKELRKKIRLSQQIEIQSKEMEERLKQAKEQEQIQESSGKQRREEERKR